jgi:HEAT repeat protein
VIPILEGDDAALKTFALRFVRETSDPASAKAFADELPKLSAEDQVRLMGALAAQKSPAARAVSRIAVLAATKASDQHVQVAALNALRWLGTASDVPLLLDTLAQGHNELGRAAKTALINVSSEEMDQQLCARLPQATGNTRRMLVELAGLRRVTAAWPELVKAANDADPIVRKAGIKALGETAKASDFGVLTDLLAKAKSDDEVAAVKDAMESVWPRIPAKTAAADRLLASLPTSEVAAKCALLQVLGMVGTQKALDAVQTALPSSEPRVHDTAVRVLADWPEATALPALLEVFRTTPDDTHRFLALRGCVRLLGLGGQPVEKKMKIYEELITRTQRSDDRKVILSGLANVHEAAALKFVEPLLTDPQVQAEAEAALLNIVDGIKGSAPAEARAAAARLQAESKNQATRDRAAKILGEMAKGR